MNSSRLLPLGVVLIFAGFLVLVVGSFPGGSGSASVGGFVLIGPFPIVFGGGPNSGTFAEVGVVVTVATIAAYIVTLLVWRSGRRGKGE